MDRIYSLRRLHEADADAYRDLRLAGLASDPASFGASFEEESGQPLSWFAERLESHDVFGGWAADGALMGVVGLLVPHAAKLRHKGVLWGMFVRSEARGTGLAAALVERAIEHVGDRVEAIRLTVVATNIPAIRLYTRLGFLTYGLEPRALKVEGRYHDEMLMARPSGMPA